MYADLAFLPENLKEYYVLSRVGLQFPVCFIFVLLTFHPSFAKIYQATLTFTMLAIVYINFGLIVVCWKLEAFSFPYEGTVMYSLFALFIFRMSLKYTFVYSFFVFLGFTVLISLYPIYGAQRFVNLGFVYIGLLVGLMGVFQIEKALKDLSKANLKLTNLSQIDHLTNIFNRRTYESKFESQLRLHKRSGDSVCVFVIDLDFFKDYNDGYGHVQGDKIIKLQAEILSNIFKRETDIVARYGGEEFVVVTSHVTQEQCDILAEKIIKQWRELKTPHGKGKANEYVTCSVGFYYSKVTQETEIDSLVKKADNALYEAKDKGRACYRQFQDG